jgi:hypothetical protein
MNNKIIFIATSIIASLVIVSPALADSYAPGMAPGEHAGWAIVNDQGQITGGVIVCTPEVCGSGWFAGQHVVLQTLQDPVEAAQSSNGVGNVAGYSNATYDFNNNRWTTQGNNGSTLEIPLAYPGADRGGNVNQPTCIDNCSTPDPITSPTPDPTSDPTPDPDPSESSSVEFSIGNKSNIVKLTDVNDSIIPLAITKGSIDSNVNQKNIGITICTIGYTSKIRPPVSYTNKLKQQQLNTTYSFYQDKNLSSYEEDHLISLELGGSPTDIRNLWPQPYTDHNARTKDQLENKLHNLVCSKTITLKEAQKAIATNWIAAYTKYMGKTP